MIRHVAWNATAYDGPASGAWTRAVALVAGLLERDVRVSMLVHPSVAAVFRADVVVELGSDAPHLTVVEVALDPRRPLLRALRSTRALVQAVPGDVDAFVTDYYPVPRALAHRTVVTVHDLRYLLLPELRTTARGLWFRRRAPALYRRARRVVVPTAAVAAQVHEFLGVSDARVVPNVLGREWRAPAQDLERTHLLLLGAADPRKDVGTVLEALESVGTDTPLLVTGRTTDDLERRLFAARDRGVDVRHVGLLSPVELRDLTDRAIALLHPSRCEGFGLPLIEALARRTPVLAAREPAVAEVTAAAGSAVTLLPPRDIPAWSAAIARSLASPGPTDSAARRHALSYDRTRATDALLSAL